MSEKRYTLTLYIAPQGAEMRYKDEKGNEVSRESSVGHVLYSISDDGGKTKKGYGFSPIRSSPIWKGHVVSDEQKIYQNFAYKRTIEISKDQYDKLKIFGESSLGQNHGSRIVQLTEGKFNTNIYRAGDNSCVDYVFHALRYSGVYDHKAMQIRASNKINEYGEVIYESVLVQDDGRVNVLNNAKIFDNIPVSQQFNYKNNDLFNFKDNQYHNTVSEELKKAPWYLRVENENEQLQEGGFQTVMQTGDSNLLEQTNNLIAQLQSGNKQALAEFTALSGVQEAASTLRTEAQELLRQNPQLAEEVLPNRFFRPEFEDMPLQVQKLYAESKRNLQEYYQEKGIRYDEDALDNTAMALAAEGYRYRMRSVTMMSFKDGQINIGDDTAPDFRMASVNEKEAGLTAGHESMTQARKTEQEFALQAQQREMEGIMENRSRGISMG